MTLGANQIAAYAADLLDMEEAIDDFQGSKRLLYYCRAHSIETSTHGRWRDRSARKAIIRAMRQEGVTDWDVIAKAVGAAEGYTVKGTALYVWAAKHMTQDERAAARRPKPKAPVEVCDVIREAARLNYGKAPASEIAKAHGVSRNVIIGHWFRLRRAGLLPAIEHEAAA